MPEQPLPEAETTGALRDAYRPSGGPRKSTGVTKVLYFEIEWESDIALRIPDFLKKWAHLSCRPPALTTVPNHESERVLVYLHQRPARVAQHWGGEGGF